MNVRNVILACSICGPAILVGAPGAQAEGSGFYGFFDVGKSDADRFIGDFDRIDGNEVSYGVGVGYTVNRYAAVQIGYHDFGNFNASAGCPPDVLCVAQAGVTIAPFSTDQVSVDAFSAQVVGTYPLRNMPIALYGKVGAIAWDSRWRTNKRLDESDTDLVYGVGVNWTPSNRWGLKLGYEEVDLDIQSFAVGGAFRF